MGGANSLVSLDIEGLTDESLVNRDNAELGVTYGENVVAQGCTMTPTVTCSAPTIKWLSEGNEGKKYTLIVTDPDAPDREEHAYREFIHWVQTDITAESLAAGTIDGAATVPYVGPGPPHNSGDHRYIFILFEQPAEGFSPESLTTAFEGRGGKRAVLAAQAAGLGQIVALNIFLAQWDESVDALHEAIGFLPPPKFRSPKQNEANPVDAAPAADAEDAAPAADATPAAESA